MSKHFGKKLVHISDTHGFHENIEMKDIEADYIVCTGDITSRGEITIMEDFLTWYQDLKGFKYKLLIAGNHDFCFEDAPEICNTILEKYPDIIYLNDSGTEIDGIKFWGSPIQPWFHNWAFNRKRGDEIKKHWDLIPKDTDVLMTHGPVFGHLDWTISGLRVGCEDLLNKVKEIKPALFLCGHIHESYGTTSNGHTVMSNASIMNVRYNPINKPVILNF